MNSTYFISSPLLSGSHYGNKGFASPMKELNERTVLTENKENKNDSYRQKTKYDDKIDKYYSTYDLEILLQNRESYLEGKLDSDQDIDCYSFSYAQKNLYTKMGMDVGLTIRLENIPEGCNYDLIVYDSAGNQIGIADDDGHGSKILSLPDWDKSDHYTIKVENHNGTKVKNEESYRIRIVEEKNPKKEEIVNEKNSADEMERLHRKQYNALPEDERYTGTASVEELLEKKASGEILSKQEEIYLKIFANLHDSE